MRSRSFSFKEVSYYDSLNSTSVQALLFTVGIKAQSQSKWSLDTCIRWYFYQTLHTMIIRQPDPMSIAKVYGIFVHIQVNIHCLRFDDAHDLVALLPAIPYTGI
ncbi:hypothetical protein NPIL_362251 [Nephila pilipes]|uniref:Uncharacterized protein n=1 Tax=Nephila pilipes TaxID=299642 RepID=A0A8X6T9B3_NEPPI|nr:hypothetical protein NPIL_362251 [Nephila pilipes]